jgi:hypothetical protein
VKTAVVLFLLSAALPFSASADTMILHKSNQGHPTSRQDVLDRCSTLQRQYADVIGGYRDDPNYGAASKLFSEGVSACQDNEINVGEMKLEAALRELGIKPVE